MAKLPIFPSTYFSWRNKRGYSTITDLDLISFPKEGFYIKSARTGQSKLFLPDSETMVNNEFFDGEGSAYFIPGEGVTIQIWM